MSRQHYISIVSLSFKGVRSAIINVGTNAAEIQNPRYQFAVYGASKSYLHVLSSGMQEVLIFNQPQQTNFIFYTQSNIN